MKSRSKVFPCLQENLAKVAVRLQAKNKEDIKQHERRKKMVAAAKVDKSIKEATA